MTKPTVADFLSAVDREEVERPCAEARGLPGHVYSSEAFYELERERFFPRRWIAVAFRSDVANPGDVLPVTVAGWELVFTRDREGKIHCFHNLCRHRGMKVATKPATQCSVVRCGWHSWTYDLQGRLVGTPNLGGPRTNDAEGFVPEDLGLVPVPCDEWMNFVFVNLDGKAGPLLDHLQPLLARCGAYDLSLLRPSDLTAEMVFEGNWKLLIEAAVEDYHIPWVHPQMVMTAVFRPEMGGRCYVGLSNRRLVAEARNRHVTESVADELPVFPHLRDATELETGVFVLVPTAVLVLWPHHAVTRLYLPEGHARTRTRTVFHLIGDAATHPKYAPAREQIREAWLRIGQQDAAYVAEVQHMSRVRGELGVATRFSPYWEPAVHHFQKLVVEALNGK